MSLSSENFSTHDDGSVLEFLPEDIKNKCCGKYDCNDLITICGVGSLLLLASAKRTFPNLQNFRKGKVRGYVRAFNLISLSEVRRGIANVETGEVCSLSAVPAQEVHLDPKKVEMLVSLFEIPIAGWKDFLEREHRYHFEAVEYMDEDIKKLSNIQCVNNQSQVNGCEHDGICDGVESQKLKYSTKHSMDKKLAVLCCQYCDQKYLDERCKGVKEFEKRVWNFWKGPIWFEVKRCSTLCTTINASLKDNHSHKSTSVQISAKDDNPCCDVSLSRCCSCSCSCDSCCCNTSNPVKSFTDHSLAKSTTLPLSSTTSSADNESQENQKNEIHLSCCCKDCTCGCETSVLEEDIDCSDVKKANPSSQIQVLETQYATIQLCKRYGHLNVDTIRPITKYIKVCIDGCKSIGGDDYLNNFLDFSYLADGKTTLRQYLDQNDDIKKQVL